MLIASSKTYFTNLRDESWLKEWKKENLKMMKIYSPRSTRYNPLIISHWELFFLITVFHITRRYLYATKPFFFFCQLPKKLYNRITFRRQFFKHFSFVPGFIVKLMKNLTFDWLVFMRSKLCWSLGFRLLCVKFCPAFGLISMNLAKRILFSLFV